MRYIFTLPLLLAAELGYAQGNPMLQPVQVLPASPTSASNIRLVFSATMSSSGVKVNTNFTRTGNALTFTGCYFAGFLPTLQTYVDTVRVGMLAPGTYTVTFIGQVSSSNQQCTEIQRNTSTTTFQVTAALATARPTAADWAVYPVPASRRTLTLKAPANQTISALRLLDVAGREAFVGSATTLRVQSGQWQLPLPELPAGSYTLTLHLTNGERVSRRVVLQ